METGISIVIPTLNASRTMGMCIEAILKQGYPDHKLEIIIADAGSTDNTIEITKGLITQSGRDIKLRVVDNPLKTGEAGKAVGIRNATNEIIALIDSDNIMDQDDWLSRLIQPFCDKDIYASEVLYWSYREKDSAIDRYCALSGINNPICLFLGNYDRYSYLTNKWTGCPLLKSEDQGPYLKIKLDKNNVPTMGANGFAIRRTVLEEIDFGDYYFDIDVIYELAQKGFDVIARPKIGIVHYYCDSISTFIRKQRRCIDDYMYFKKMKLRTYPHPIGRSGFLIFILFTVLTIPSLIQAFIGYCKKKDRAWFLHPIMCWIVLIVYGLGTVKAIFKRSIYQRKTWKQ